MRKVQTLPDADDDDKDVWVNPDQVSYVKTIKDRKNGKVIEVWFGNPRANLTLPDTATNRNALGF